MIKMKICGSDGEESASNAGQDDPLEKGMATHSSILAWRILSTEEPGGLQSMGSPSQTRLPLSLSFHRTPPVWAEGTPCLPCMSGTGHPQRMADSDLDLGGPRRCRVVVFSSSPSPVAHWPTPYPCWLIEPSFQRSALSHSQAHRPCKHSGLRIPRTQLHERPQPVRRLRATSAFSPQWSGGREGWPCVFPSRGSTGRKACSKLGVQQCFPGVGVDEEMEVWV